MEHKEHHEREIWFLLSFLVIFAIVFIVAFLNIRRGVAVLGFGMPYAVEDGIVLVLSVLAMIKVVWEIVVH